jgi:hypothetical protein
MRCGLSPAKVSLKRSDVLKLLPECASNIRQVRASRHQVLLPLDS